MGGRRIMNHIKMKYGKQQTIDTFTSRNPGIRQMQIDGSARRKSTNRFPTGSPRSCAPMMRQQRRIDTASGRTCVAANLRRAPISSSYREFSLQACIGNQHSAATPAHRPKQATRVSIEMSRSVPEPR
jgi:hypothetical protein